MRDILFSDFLFSFEEDSQNITIYGNPYVRMNGVGVAFFVKKVDYFFEKCLQNERCCGIITL